MTKPEFQRSPDTRFLVQKLRTVKVGELISYEDLATEVVKPIARIRNALISARRILLREENIVFDVERDIGLRRLTDTQIVGTATKSARHIRRTARKAVQTLQAVADFSALPRDDQMRHSASVSVFGAVAEMTMERGLSKLQKAVDEKALPFAATLEAFRK